MSVLYKSFLHALKYMSRACGVFLSDWCVKIEWVFYFESSDAVTWLVTSVVMWPHLNMAARRNKTSAGHRVSMVLALNVVAVLVGSCFLCDSVEAEVRTAVLDKQTGKLSVLEGYQEDFVAWGNFTDDIDTSGWVDSASRASVTAQ